MTTKKRIVTNNDAAIHIGCAPNSLKQSRSTGKLFSVQAPPHLKMGTRAVRYDLDTLDAWLEQFSEQANTAQINHAQ